MTVNPRTRTLAAAALAGALTVAGGGWAVAQFENPTASAPAEFVAIDAYRAVDTRGSNAGGDFLKDPDVRSGAYFLELGTDVDGNQRIPEDAIAVSYNVTVARTEGDGYLGIGGVGLFTEDTSVVAWLGDGQRVVGSGQTTTVERYEDVEGNQLVLAKIGGDPGVGADVIIDVTGYYLPAG